MAGHGGFLETEGRRGRQREGKILGAAEAAECERPGGPLPRTRISVPGRL